MREIKFRTWRKDRKMTYSDQEGVSLGSLLTGYEDYPEDVELMQYTGLKDKNGVEIYEGDIVKMFGGNYSIAWQNGKLVRKLGISEESRYLEIGLLGEYAEVIDNIYENPELLTNKE